MSLRRYQKTLDRHQEMIFPPSVDDYISEYNIVRNYSAPPERRHRRFSSTCIDEGVENIFGLFA
jgi:hypothetical protein